MQAIAEIHDSTTGDVLGNVYFDQVSMDPPMIKVEAMVDGIYPADSDHGFHVHMYGDMTRGCDSMGPHFTIDPNMTHGGRTGYPRHDGDLGSVYSDYRGRVREQFQVKGYLYGPYGWVGRGIVIHEQPDDFGLRGDEESLKTGNSGDRIACGIIRPLLYR